MNKLQAEIDQLKNDRDKYKKSFDSTMFQLIAERQKNKELKKELEDIEGQVKKAVKESKMVKLLSHYVALVNTLIGPEASELIYTAASRMQKQCDEKESE